MIFMSVLLKTETSLETTRFIPLEADVTNMLFVGKTGLFVSLCCKNVKM